MASAVTSAAPTAMQKGVAAALAYPLGRAAHSKGDTPRMGIALAIGFALGASLLSLTGTRIEVAKRWGRAIPGASDAAAAAH